MTNIEKLENAVKKLSKTEMSLFRKWFLRYDAVEWDKKIKKDAESGRLSKLAENSLTAYRAGKAKEL